MRIIFFYHSLISDWNHGNAHFLRGIATELLSRGYDVEVYEPQDSWSYRNLVAHQGRNPLDEFKKYYPQLKSRVYSEASLDLNKELDEADLVLVHEWNTPELVKKIGIHHSINRNYILLFHDTHHRMISDFASMSRFELKHYDGVLAFGHSIRNLYLSKGMTQRAWTWHEAADTRVFFPLQFNRKNTDLVWIGNWGDEERTQDLYDYLIKPVRNLGLLVQMYGVRYPLSAKITLEESGIEYGGWVPNYRVPELFAQSRVTVHIPRRPYAEVLRGIPTIRVFEALACGIPLISTPWTDSENLFTEGSDYLIARNPSEMQRMIKAVLYDVDLSNELTAHGRRTILNRHTCAHRVDELLAIYNELRHPIIPLERLVHSLTKEEQRWARG